MSPVRWLLLTLALSACVTSRPPAMSETRAPSVAYESLFDFSVSSLRQRTYGATIVVEKVAATVAFSSSIVSYRSDGLRVYARVDLPSSSAPEAGHPVVVFIHGWRGIEAAPSLGFYYAPESYYHDMVNAYREAGFAVLTPGFRGHGTVNGIAADGIEDMARWDQGSYLSPVLYAVDVMNLLDGLSSMQTDQLDLSRVNLVGHSQGGDVALLIAAVAADDSGLAQHINAVSVWNGLVAPRLVQARAYGLMQNSAEAFLAGDGAWNGSANGRDGRVNPHFVFGWPPEWIESPDPATWTWQRETWGRSTADALVTVMDKLYDALNQNLPALQDARYRIKKGANAGLTTQHDPRVAAGLAASHAAGVPEKISAPLNLHFSDRDMYSLPTWNRQLCVAVNHAGGSCRAHEYVGNTHRLRLSERLWYSAPEHREGFATAVSRDVRLFETRSAR